MVALCTGGPGAEFRLWQVCDLLPQAKAPGTLLVSLLVLLQAKEGHFRRWPLLPDDRARADR
jgi:hypothetical protein